MMNTSDVGRPAAPWGPVLFGAAVWVAVLAVSALSSIDLTIFQVFLVLGMLVVVPLGLPLVGFPRASSLVGDPARIAVCAAVLVVGAVVLTPGPLAAALTIPWFVVVTGFTLVRLAVWRRGVAIGDGVRLADGIDTIACAWLVVGATSLTLSRAQLPFLSVPPPLIELGAVHFSYAGFAAAVIAGQLLRHHHRSPASVAAAALTVGGATVVLVGHLTIRPLELAGALAMVGGVALIGALSWSAAPPRTAARLLLRLAAVAVVIPMVLAVQYAWAITTGGSHLPYETIAAIHGTLNAFGFSIGALVAWRLAGNRAATSDDACRGKRSSNASSVEPHTVVTG